MHHEDQGRRKYQVNELVSVHPNTIMNFVLRSRFTSEQILTTMTTRGTDIVNL